MAICYGRNRILTQYCIVSHQVKNKQNHLIEIRTVVADVDRLGLTGNRNDRMFWCDGNVFILIEPRVTQTYAFVKIYQLYT